MAIKVYDTIKPANDSFVVAEAHDISYTSPHNNRTGRLTDFMFVYLTEAEYLELRKNGTVNGITYNPNTPFLIISEDDMNELRNELNNAES
jgi:hypothetical protein